MCRMQAAFEGSPSRFFCNVTSQVGAASEMKSFTSFQPVSCIFCKVRRKQTELYSRLSSKLCTMTARARCEDISDAATNLSWRTWSFLRLVTNKLYAAWMEFFLALLTLLWAELMSSSVCFPAASCTNGKRRKSKSGSRPFLKI